MDVTSYQNVKEEARQVTKDNKVAVCLHGVILHELVFETRNKGRNSQTIMTGTSETWPHTSRTKRLLETTGMIIVRRISGETFLDMERRKRLETHVDNMIKRMGLPVQKTMELTQKSNGGDD